MTFDGFDMQAGGIVTSRTTFYSPAKRNIQEEQLAESDGVVFVKDFLGAKSFTCSGTLKASTIAATDTLIDTFLAAMNKSKKLFVIDYAGGSRQIMVTPQLPIIVREDGLNLATWSIEFKSENSAASDTTSSTLITSTAITTTATPIALTVVGSYKAEPYITFTLTSVTGGTSKTITISNGTSLRGISINRTWANGDILEIDSLNKTVYVNSVAVESTGLWPSWDSGAGSLLYNDDFTTRSGTIVATYTKRYL